MWKKPIFLWNDLTWNDLTMERNDRKNPHDKRKIYTNADFLSKSVRLGQSFNKKKVLTVCRVNRKRRTSELILWSYTSVRLTRKNLMLDAS